MIDTHTHLYMGAYSEPEQASESLAGQLAAVERACAAGVSTMITPNVDLQSIEPMKRLWQAAPEKVRMAMGLHPTEIGEDWRATLSPILEELHGCDKQYVAVGECGIDLYWQPADADAQMQAFDAQLAAAATLGLPVIIHCRDGLDQCLEVLQGHRDVPAVFHSFGGTPDDVERIRRVGDYYFGINGIVTFKNSGLRSTLPSIGMDRLLTETDAPYLAPTPHRGKRNESAMMPLIVDTMALAMGVDAVAMAAATEANALRLFPRLAAER